MSRLSRKGAAAIAVIALCVILNVAMALAPKEREREGELPPAPQSAPADKAKGEVGSGEIPIPEDLPEGSDPEALITAVEGCLEENGLTGRTSLAIVESGEGEQIAVGTPQSTWWVYEAVMPDGTAMPFTVGYNAEAGFYAAVQ